MKTREGSPLLVDQFNFKEKAMSKANQIQKSQFVKDNVVDSEDYDQWIMSRSYGDTLDSFVEYYRHLFQHGTDHTKEKRTLRMDSDGLLFDPNPEPRKQYMASIEETEVAASIYVGHVICQVLVTFAKQDTFSATM